jgi:hypothetical protein
MIRVIYNKNKTKIIYIYIYILCQDSSKVRTLISYVNSGNSIFSPGF